MYINKSIVIEAYKVLSTLSDEPSKQGATQTVSAIRYFMALDEFYKHHNMPCDTKSDYAKAYIEYVGNVVRVDQKYTTNFYHPLKYQDDYAVGSNFYSVNAVNNSLVNKEDIFQFPRRGNVPLFDIKAGSLIRNIEYYDTFNKYIVSDRYKLALAIWVLRNKSIDVSDNIVEGLNKAMTLSYTQEFIDVIFKDVEKIIVELKHYSNSDFFVDTYQKLQDSDIEDIFIIENIAISTLNICGSNKIYFGAPGTGKSHTIKNEDLKGVADDCIFRTTFHPDSDYSSFVGCYKPISHNSRILRVDYTIDDLASMLHQNYADAPNKVTALHSFVLEYADYFNGKIAAFNKKDLIAKSGLSATYEVEVGKIVNLNQWMVDNGYMSTPSTISYEFSPEVFTNAYVEAWNNPTKPIYLIIEEINRGNCAQVFGDIFQLLDREDGVSEYAIKADAALCQYLQRSLRGEGLEGVKDGKLKLPSNLSILATMNTSDQSLFPMDSAFKRRWEWEFIPINSSEVSYAKIVIDSKEYSWSTFIEKVNEKIMNTCKSEDKQLGAFFIKVSKEKPEIDWKLFRSKVMSFLWFDVYKDLYESDENTVFRYYKDDKQEESVEFSFGKLFDGEEKKQIKLLQDFMEYINKE